MVAAISAPSAAEGDASILLPSSRYTELGSCTEIAHGNVEEGADWISYKCDGIAGIPIWLTYSDSARSFLGIGLRENRSGMFGLLRDPSWPVEWRGSERDGGFEPFATIIRMPVPEGATASDDEGLLFVYRLRAEGTACIIASQLSSNDEAREIADASRDRFTCLFEPHLLEAD